MYKNKEKKGGTIFFCQNCGYESAKWSGQCPACREWNTFAEEPAAPKTKGGSSRRSAREVREPVTLKGIEADSEGRISTGMSELDQVLGGGIVPGSLVLVGGDPGIGKSTLLLQVCRNLAERLDSILYISGEESLQQIKLRAVRIGEFSDAMTLLCETNLDDIESIVLKKKPQAVIIDSIQTMYQENVSSAPGSVSQVREATGVLMRLAKENNITIFIVGHVTKEGTVAGPRVLEHMVDTVLYFEGDRYASYRILRSVKNRFGSTNEIGVFEMTDKGLREVSNPSEYMLSGKPEGASGSVVACTMEGTRPMLLEVQALVCRTNFGSTCVGSDVQLGEYIAKQLGVEPLFVEMEFDDCLKAAKEGTVDLVLLGMLPKNDRKASVDFTEEYYKPGKQVLLVTEEKQKKYKDLDAFTGKTVVAQYGTLQAQLVMEQMPETYMTLIDVVSDGIEMLRSGKADAVALDEAVAEDLMKEDDDLALSALELEYEAAGVVGGVVKDQKVFLDAVNKAIEEVKVQKLYYNWLAEATHQAAQKNPAIDDSEMTRERDRTKKTTVKMQTPATQPATDPATQPATDPATQPATDPAVQPAG